jgi:hypothetical protein
LIEVMVEGSSVTDTILSVSGLKTFFCSMVIVTG